MTYIKYGVLAAVLLIVGVFIFSAPAKQSIQEWRPAVVPEETVGTEKFSASPPSGFAPLRVTFFNMETGGPFHVSNYPRINYGDGTIEDAARCVEGSRMVADACTKPGRNVHTYASPGTYTVILSQPTGDLPSPESQDRILGTVTITVR